MKILDVEQLVNDVNRIISEMDKGLINDAVNWGNVECDCVKKVEELWPLGWVKYEVFIEEAAPIAHIFKDYIESKLADIYPNRKIYVFTEW